MTIRKGSSYGEHRPLPSGSPIASSDAELRDLVVSGRSTDSTPPVIGLLGGDLYKTLGGTGDHTRLTGEDALTVPIDLAVATVDGIDVPFVSHLLVGSLFGHDFFVAMNAQWFNEFDLGPRSHPGDGLLDITSGSLPWRQRRAALKRATTGSHLPHPRLSYRRTASETVMFDHPVTICFDGVLTMKAQSIDLCVEPDAFFVVV